MERCDVLIVGGGPAGSACAWRLRRRGMDVLLLDRAEFPRDKVCAGWITPQVLQALELEPGDYARERVLQPITGFRTGLIGGRSRETRYGEVVSYGIRRCEFDHWLLRRSGARLRLGEPLERLERHGAGWVVNGAIATPMLVGAGGHACPVARWLGAKRGSRLPLVAAREAEIRLEGAAAAGCGARGETPEFYFSRDLKGYGWCVRKGDWLNLGLGREDKRNLPGRLRDFLAWLQEQGRIPPLVSDQEFRGHAYLLYGHGSRPLSGAGVLLVGDAAGVAYPRSGEGIRPAVESGLLAADLIAGAGGDYREQRLALYAVRLRDRLGAPQRHGSAVASKAKAALSGVLLQNRWFIRHVLLDRWFLRRSQPALTPTRVRASR